MLVVKQFNIIYNYLLLNVEAVLMHTILESLQITKTDCPVFC